MNDGDYEKAVLDYLKNPDARDCVKFPPCVFGSSRNNEWVHWAGVWSGVKDALIEGRSRVDEREITYGIISAIMRLEKAGELEKGLFKTWDSPHTQNGPWQDYYRIAVLN
ncbi:MAG: hypothetical protein WC548_00675 [Candidatus Pacearchaeota archaeon]